MRLRLKDIPASHPVRPLWIHEIQQAKDPCICDTCGLAWDDAVCTSMTPTPAGRCPFEYFHKDIKDKASKSDKITLSLTPKQLDELMLCVRFCLNNGVLYGEPTDQPDWRQALLYKLQSVKGG